MAKQTINVGTSPNDGTGTPLRTAFQYTNSNFSELYTAVGPSGNNIVVPGTATITGDLTVRTNKLAVTSTGVGCGTATPADSLHVYGSGNALIEGTAGLYPRAITKVGAKVWQFGYRSGTTNFEIQEDSVERYTIGNGGTPHTWYIGASTAMTLNSTGLGVGGSPVNKLTVTVAPGTSTSDGLRVTDSTRSIIAGQTGATYSYLGIGGNQNLIYTSGGRLDIVADGQSLFLRTGTANYLNLDSSGNVGVGVTPNTWTTYKALQVQSASVWSTAGNDTAYASNVYYDGAYKFRSASSEKACMYIQFAGQHQWHYTASAGTAGNTAAFTQAMTLDASGNLLVGTTDTGSNSGIGIKSVYSSTAPYVATVGSSTSASQYSYLLYSTGGTPAYKFYVSYSGQISATSGTVAALSDARFKENVQDIDVGLGAILALKPRKFDWKAGKGKDIKGDRGFIAQEFEQVFPNLIEEWADPAPEGEAPYKSVRQDLIPVLVKAIQELTARVEALEA